MKSKSHLFFKQATLIIGALLMVTFISCKDDEPLPDPIASFQYEVSEDNFLEITFINYSQNATSFAWEFGDGETSTEKDPVHTFPETGSYTVKLTATNEDGASHFYEEALTIDDPDEALKRLTGKK